MALVLASRLAGLAVRSTRVGVGAPRRRGPAGACTTEGQRARHRLRHRAQEVVRTKRWLFVAAVVVVLAGAGVGHLARDRQLGCGHRPDHHDHVRPDRRRPGRSPRRWRPSGTIEPASQANLNFAVSGRVTAVERERRADGDRRSGARHHRRHVAHRPPWPRPRPPWPTTRRSCPPTRRTVRRSAQIASDKANIASAQTQVTSAQSLARRRHPDVDDRRHGGLGQPHRRPAGDRTRLRRPASSAIGVLDGSGGIGGGSGSGASGGVELRRFGLGIRFGASSSSSSSGRPVVVGTDRRGLDRVLHRELHRSTAPRSARCRSATRPPSPCRARPRRSTARSARSGCWPPRPRVSRPSRWSIDVTGSPSGLYGGSSANVSIITEELQNVVVVPTDRHHLQRGRQRP